MTGDELHETLLRTHPQLSRFNPLRRILFLDDFDEGINGWCQLLSNHDGNLDNVRFHAHAISPQLSNCSFFDIGTHGSMSGTYALKLATRPIANDLCPVIKRLTFQKRGRVQFEMYFTYKAEQVFEGKRTWAKKWDGNYAPSENDFGEFTISNDICEGDEGPRYMGALRYLNTDKDGNPVQKWMFKTSVQVTTKMALSGVKSTDYHVVDPGDWQEIPGGYQPMCFNETATKINWHYLRWVFDTLERRNVELQVNTRTFDLTAIPVPHYPHGYHGLSQLLNFLVDVRTHVPVRNFLLIDSILVSVDW